ncbi:MAG: polysaccharide deacetylase family protein [Clostridia bacterium]|nr:polysaccharide deacetylase family protein [Clostridia bacterium]
MKYLSLVFDDGPRDLMCEMTDKIRGFGWSAAFAIIGNRINDETLPMLKYVIDNGFQIVSHGQDHSDLRLVSSKDEIINELTLPIKTVKQKLNYEITMARLPFLSASGDVLEIAKDLKLPLLGQGIDGGDDWDSSVNSDRIIEAVLGSACDGAIGCLHVLGHTSEALDVILPELKKRDFHLVTPEELFVKNGITPPLGVQINNANEYFNPAVSSSLKRPLRN